MITAGEPHVFFPLGQEHLSNHPGDVYLPVEKSPPAPTPALHFNQDLLRALQGFSLKDQPHKKEGCFLRESPDDDDGEEEFYFKGKSIVWSKSNGHGIRSVIKSFTMENNVNQVLWADFNVCGFKPRRMEPKPEIPEAKSAVVSGLCAVESAAVSVFTPSGESYISTIPFQISKAWVTKYGLLLQRVVGDGCISKRDNGDSIPIIFSLLHPLDDVSPVIKKMSSATGITHLSFFCHTSEEIIFSSCDPSLIVTFNKAEGVHSIWKLRTTSFEEAEYACSRVMHDSQITANTPLGHSFSHFASSSSHSKHTFPSQTPSNICSPFRSYASSRVASPGGSQSYSPSPAVSSLTHMATLSRSCSPSATSSISRRYDFTPYPAVHRSPLSPLQSPNECEFMDPLAPDLCFEHQWTECHWLGEAATKVFLSYDVTGHNFLCYLLKKHQQLRVIKFDESNDSSQWIFGTSSIISALDAEALPSLNLIIILECNFTLSLFTGLIKVSKVHVSEGFGPLSEWPNFCSQEMSLSTAFGTPRRRSVITSTRPPSRMDARFTDEVQGLSPVPILEDSSKSVLMSDEPSLPPLGVFKGLRDAIRNKVTVQTTSGSFRIPLPKVAESVTVTKSLLALRAVLPRDIYTQIFVKWYCTRNAPGPGDMTCEFELNTFLVCLLQMIGYNTEYTCLGGYVNHSTSYSESAKKQKTNGDGSEDDWDYLLSSNFHNSFWNNKAHWMGLNMCSGKSLHVASGRPELNMSAILLPYIAHVLYSIHMVYEDSKLNVLEWNDLTQLGNFLFELARDLQLEKYMDLYWKDFPDQFKSVSLEPLLSDDQLKKIHFPAFFSLFPNIYAWLLSVMECEDIESFPYIPQVTLSLRNIALTYLTLIEPGLVPQDVGKYLVKISTPGVRVQEDTVAELFAGFRQMEAEPKKAVMTLLARLNVTVDDVDVLPIGVSLMLRDAILHCRHYPLSEWHEDIYNLIGRQDLLALHLAEKGKNPMPISKKCPSENSKHSLPKESEDGFQYLDHEVLRLRYSKDLRIHEVYHMLQSSKPVRIVVKQRPEVSDHEFIEEQERHLYSLCIRTMALPVGRGMLTLHSYAPVVTETLPIPKLCLTGRAPPRNVVVDLSHIDIPPNMNMWPLFHNGVAAGLRITPNASQIDSTWMVYNKPRSSSSDTPTEHAGFLMALGLNGCLSNLTTMSIHDYLCKGHELTSVGVLLGVSAAMRGTMDIGITKLLSIHIEALLPPTSTELDVPPIVQVAAVMGIGLLYQGSSHHHMAEVMLSEIGRPPGPEMEHCVDRESYSLAAGLALGLITFGKGKEVSGLTDLPMADQLYHYMIGGHKRPLTGVHKEKHKSPSYQIREGDSVNVDVTSPGATLALGMMFFNSGNEAIADWMKAPDTQFLLDMVRPDFLLLRVLGRGLILWSNVVPSREWVESNVPKIVLKYAFKRGEVNDDVDYETMSQAYSNIIAGSCLCLGLKFAGSANGEAFETLMHYAKFFLSLMGKSVSDQAGRSTVETCLNVSVLSLAMVMAGTGDIDVMRLCRHLRSRVSQASSYVLYGSHMATHMALGLLFLGGGRYTLSTAPLAIGAMLCAFYPKFPTHSNDNRYHLQALYHFYVLATEPRLVIPRQLNSQRPLYAHVKVIFKDTPWYQNVEYTMKAPCLLPELKLLKQVIIEDSRYWPIVFDCDKNWNVLSNLLKNGGSIHLKQKAGCLPHNEDPQGFRSLMAQTYINNSVYGWNIKNSSLTRFSSDPQAFHFANCFLHTTAKTNLEVLWQQQVCSVLFECASQEKMDVLPIYMMLLQILGQLESGINNFDVLHIRMLSAFRDLTTYGNVSPLDGYSDEDIAAFVSDFAAVVASHVAGDPAAADSVTDDSISADSVADDSAAAAATGGMADDSVATTAGDTADDSAAAAASDMADDSAADFVTGCDDDFIVASGDDTVADVEDIVIDGDDGVVATTAACSSDSGVGSDEIDNENNCCLLRREFEQYAVDVMQNFLFGCAMTHRNFILKYLSEKWNFTNGHKHQIPDAVAAFLGYTQISCERPNGIVIDAENCTVFSLASETKEWKISPYVLNILCRLITGKTNTLPTIM